MAVGTISEPIKELTKNGPKRPRVSYWKCLFIREWIFCVIKPEINPPALPIASAIPIFGIKGAADPIEIPPLIVPTKAYL
jgi:hypothetical protein